MIAPEDLIRWFALGYWVVMLAIVLFIWLFVCLLIPKGHKWWVGILTSIAVMAVFIVPIAKVDIQEKQENTVKQEKYLAAKTVYDARCKNAGFKIYRTVDNVEGVTLLNVWPDEKKYSDQMWSTLLYQGFLVVTHILKASYHGGNGITKLMTLP